jgi:cobalamin biosynthesis protein CobT
MVIRDATEAVVSMLASRRIRVTQQGMGAFVEWHPTTHQPIRVNVPNLPDDASDELIDAVQGFIDHEVGHLLHTNPKVSAEAHALGEEIKQLENAIEDPRIEQKQTRTFKGAAFNLANTGRFVIREIVEPGYRSAKNSGDTEGALAHLIMPMIRATCGQPEWIEFMKDKWPEVQGIVDRAGPALMDQIRNCLSTEDALNCAKELHKAIGKMTPPPPQPPEPQKGKSSAESEPGQGEQGGGSQKGEKQEGKKGKGQKQKEQPKPEEGEEETPAGGKGEDEEQGEPEPQEQGAGSDSPEGEEQEPEEGDDGCDEAPQNAAIDGKRILKALRSLEDYDESISKAISARAFNEAKGSDYIVFTRDEDEVVEMPITPNAVAAIPQMEQEVDAMIGPLSRELERIIVAKSASFWTGGHRKGRLHGASLSRLRLGRDDVFRQRHDSNTKKVAFSIMIDNSGSMHSIASGKIKTAAFSAYALASMLDRLQIPNEVIGFTTKAYSAEVLDAMRKDPLLNSYARANALFVPIYKSFNERVTTDVKARFVSAVQNYDLADYNVDGESLMIGLRRVLTRPEKRRIMIVLSDGRPATRGNGDLDAHLRAVVKTIQGAGVELFGIGICDESVRNFYPRHVVIQRVDQLPGAVMGELRRFVLQQ